MGNKDKVQIFIRLGLFVTIVLFFISPDSYTHDIFNRCDSAWFFMCGKAWMNGMIPYVDFADSKGPLLWLIYGIGYLLSPQNYIGVFWISCIWYWLIYYYTYKTSYIFLKDKQLSILCTLLMTLAYFNPWFHYETRAEDFCQLFIVLSIYRTCHLLYTKQESNKDIYITFFILGISFGSLLLIKYNIAAMQSICILYSIYYIFKSKIRIVKPIGSLIVGIATITLPFIFYFIIIGSLNDFINEYFINTYLTLSSPEPIKKHIISWTYVFQQPDRLSLLIVIIIGSLIMSKKNVRYNWFPLIGSIFFINLSITSALPYYMNSNVFWCIFPVCLFIPYICKLYKTKHVFISIIGFTIIVLTSELYKRPNLFYHDLPMKKDYYAISSLMKSTPNPTIINIGYETGIGLPAHTLPGCKYWSTQNGATPKMIKEQKKSIINKRTKFLYIQNYSITKDIFNLNIDTLRSIGYEVIYEMIDNNKKEQFLLINRSSNNI